jgi:hypothetical protein
MNPQHFEQIQSSVIEFLAKSHMPSLQVMTKHRQASPDCPFVKNQSDNVPLLPGGAEERPSERTAGEERTGQDRVPDSGIGSQEEETDDASHFSSRSSGGRISITQCCGSGSGIQCLFDPGIRGG